MGLSRHCVRWIASYGVLVAMKVKRDRSHNVVLEMGRKEAPLPPVALPEWRLKHILVPVDFSAGSHKALHYAAGFAKQFNAEVTLLHVLVAVPPPTQMMIFETETLTAQSHEDAARELAEWRKEITSQASVKAVVRAGTSAYREIVLAADECNTDLIIIGNHGHSGLAHILLGRTTERVVRHAPCPVFVVREREHDFLERAEIVESGEQSGAV